jgi:hypothetical protein
MPVSAGGLIVILVYHRQVNDDMAMRFVLMNAL